MHLNDLPTHSYCIVRIKLIHNTKLHQLQIKRILRNCKKKNIDYSTMIISFLIKRYRKLIANFNN